MDHSYSKYQKISGHQTLQEKIGHCNLPFSATDVGYAMETDEEYDPKVAKIEQKIYNIEKKMEKIKTKIKNETNQKKLEKHERKLNQLETKLVSLNEKLIHVSDNTIPTNKLIKRIGDKRKSFYPNEETFEKSQASIQAYITADIPNNKWNKQMVKAQIKINNFDSIIGNPGHGHELVALVAEKKQLNGKYNPSEPVRKYHDWIKSQYDIPDTKKEINDRILEIIGEKKYNKIVKKIYKTYNKMAEHGNVPDELSDSDPLYWIQITSIKMCEYDPTCDLESELAQLHIPETSEAEIQAIKEFEQNNGIDPETGGSDKTISEKYGLGKVLVKKNVNLNVRCGSDHCGTYSLTVDSPKAYKWVKQ